MSAVSGDDYILFCDGLRRLCGIDLSQYKRPQMERRLRSFFARQGIHSLSESLPRLRASQDELEALLDRVTINVSQLWRHPEQWRQLENGLLAGLVRNGRLSAWSAGSSYGAEAFTLAAVARRTIPGAHVRILGTDIDPRMVQRAQEGTFRAEDAHGVPPQVMARGFEQLPSGGWKARPELRAMTRFQVGDLLRLVPPRSTYDLVMCRNTVIYFSEPVRDELHSRLASALRPGGVLVIGPTERVTRPAELGLQNVHPFVYRKA